MFCHSIVVSMITIKTAEQIKLLRHAGKIHVEVLTMLTEMLRPGITALELDTQARKLVVERGGEPSFLGYRPDKYTPKFPASLCVSINEVVVHGIPKADMVIQDGDVVSLDLGVKYKGVFVDGAVTIAVGDVDEKKKKLLADTKQGMMLGIEAARAGNHVGDIGHAIESFNAGRYGNVRELAGHGVGLAVHEEPFVPNYGKPGTGPLLKPGMVLAIEPMFNLGTSDVRFHSDGYTVTTMDNKTSAHFEHTILITEGEPEILTL
jgi:methionyl aminopeptidase